MERVGYKTSERRRGLEEFEVLPRANWATTDDHRRLGHFDTEPLRLFIEHELRTKLGINMNRERDITFEELFELTGIELNIVVLAAPSTPIVLSKWSAPECQVSYAAVASSGIPVVMTPQVIPQLASLGSEFVIDGGAWANYPTFVFKDPSVRLLQCAATWEGLADRRFRSQEQTNITGIRQACLPGRAPACHRASCIGNKA